MKISRASYKNYDLTAREAQILKFMTEGYSNMEIAQHLVISVNTTKAHVASILQKLEVDDRLQAALKALKEPCEVKLTTDSKYVCDSVTKGWVYSWQKNNWKKADKKPALNVDLWEELLPLLEKHTVTFNWVKGHNGHPYNERCDELAVNYYKNL